MKPLKQISIIGLSIMFILSSCSVEKRLYMSGYHFDWHNWKHNAVSQEMTNNNPNENILSTETDSIFQTLTASTDNSLIPTFPNEVSLFKAVKQLKTRAKQIKTSPPDECDIIILRNGNEIKAKITEIGINEIKYKKCDYTEGPTYTVQKSEVFMIKYPNGTKDVFSDTDYEEQPKTIDEPKYREESKTEPEKKELSYSEKYVKGQIDAGQYHNASGWYYAGVLLGLIGILIAALSAPVPRTYSNELSLDPAYREGYKKAARKRNVLSALYGWLIFLLFFFLILSIAGA